MVASLIVARFRERTHGNHYDFLCPYNFIGPSRYFGLKEFILISKEISYTLQSEMCPDSRVKDGSIGWFGNVIFGSHRKPSFLIDVSGI